MEKGKISVNVKLARINKIVLGILLGGLISCGNPGETNTNKENMDKQDGESTELMERILELNASKINGSEQIVLVTNTEISSPLVTIQTLEKIDDQWKKKFSDIRGSIGGNGFSPKGKKREGDKTSPTGIFDLGPAFGYAEHVETAMDYRQATEQDYWIDDPQSDHYNQWVTLEEPPSVSHERMKRDDNLYKLGIVVQYNTEETVKGHGSAIFTHIHREPGAPTAGCVALPEGDLSRIIKWLNPDKKPLIIMGTASELEKVKM
jgi:L,D-peptidoglycan transpeptidase YkuD (ErfK/YbiS/YcfS/YnhG family)